MTVKVTKTEPSIFGELSLEDTQTMINKSAEFGQNRTKWLAASQTLVGAKK